MQHCKAKKPDKSWNLAKVTCKRIFSSLYYQIGIFPLEAQHNILSHIISWSLSFSSESSFLTSLNWKYWKTLEALDPFHFRAMSQNRKLLFWSDGSSLICCWLLIIYFSRSVKLFLQCLQLFYHSNYLILGGFPNLWNSSATSSPFLPNVFSDAGILISSYHLSHGKSTI